MESLRVDIIDPKARKLLEHLAEMELIKIKSQDDLKREFFKLVQSLRAKKSPLSMEEITKEVKAIRKRNSTKE